MKIKRRTHYIFKIPKKKIHKDKASEVFKIHKEKPYKNDELDLLIQGIVSDNVCGALYLNYKNRILRLNHFSKYVQIPFGWLMDYYRRWGSAPKDAFEEVFKVKTRNVEPDLKEIINWLLTILNDRHIEEMKRLEGSQNLKTEEYYIKEMLPRFQIQAESKRLREELDKAESTADTDRILEIIEKRKFLDGSSKVEMEGVETMTLENLDAEFEITDSLWKQHVPSCEPVIIEGREGLGKTSLAVIITLDILRKYKQKIVVWLLCDSSPNDTKKLFYSFWTKQERKKYQDRLFFLKKNGEYSWSFSLHTSDDRLKLVEGLDKAIHDSGGKEIAAVFIDSVRGMTPYKDKDDSVGKTMMRTVQPIICQRFKAACVYLHHWNKDPSKSDRDRSAGSTATRGAARLIYALKETKFDNVKIILATKPTYNRIPILESNVDIDDEKKWILRITPARENWPEILSSGDDNKSKSNNQIDIAMTFLMEKFKKSSKYFAADLYNKAKKNDPTIGGKTLLRAANKLKVDINRDSRNRSVWVCTDFYETT